MTVQLTRLNSGLSDALRDADPNRAARLNADFHRELYRGADSQLLFDMVNMSNLSWDLYPLADRYFWELAVGSDKIAREIVEQHSAIIAAIDRGDPEAAWHAAKNHIQASGYLMDEEPTE